MVRNKWPTALSISIGSLMGAIDASIVNVALPQLQGAIGASMVELTWISTAYTMALVTLMPLASYLGRRIGQKRLYLACLVLFIAGSILAGFATSFLGLVAARVIQALGAGVLQPTEQAILRQTFPKNEQGTAMAVFGIVIMLGPAIGPSLGGFILEHASWSWIFFVNVPIGFLGVALVAMVFEEDPALVEADRKRALVERASTDWAGMVLLTVGLAVGEWVLEEGASHGWFESRWVASATAVAAAALVAFVLRELTAKAPIIDLRLLRDRTFTAGMIMNGTLMGLLFSTMFFQPLFMEQLLGLTPMRTATMLLPRSLAMMGAIVVVGPLSDRLPARLLLGVGLAIIVGGMLDMSHLTGESGTTELVRSSILQGIGFAFLLVPMETAMLTAIPKERVADATAMNSLVTETGGAIGLAVMSTVFERNHALAYAAVSAQVDAKIVFRFGSHAVEAVAREASVLAYERTFLVTAMAFVVVAPLLVLIRPLKTESAES